MQNSKICFLRNTCLLGFLAEASCRFFLSVFLVGFRTKLHGQHHILRSCFLRNGRRPLYGLHPFPCENNLFLNAKTVLIADILV